MQKIPTVSKIWRTVDIPQTWKRRGSSYVRKSQIWCDISLLYGLNKTSVSLEKYNTLEHMAN